MDKQTELGDDLLDSLARIKASMIARINDGDFRKCPHLAAPENYCDGKKHGEATAGQPDDFPEIRETRMCPTEEMRILRKRRCEVLDRSPHIAVIARRYSVAFNLGKPLWSQLLDAMRAEAPVRVQVGGRDLPLSRVIEMVRKGCEAPTDDAPHMMLTGPCGTGKTTLQAVMYLAAAEAGIDAIFVDSINIRELVNELNSKFGPTAEKAEKELDLLLRRKVLFWSDVGDTQATRKEFAETISTLLERFAGRLVTSTNQTPAELERHPDIGQRAASRMLATRNAKLAIVLAFTGPDQRRAGMRGAQQEITAL